MKLTNKLFLIYCLSTGPGFIGIGLSQSSTEPVKTDLRNRASELNMSNESVQENKVANPAMDVTTTGTLNQQAVSWKEVVQLNPKMANAWQNYYESTRYSYYSTSSKELTAAEKTQLDGIITDMEKNVPQSFEYHYIKYLNGNHDVSQFSHLQKAYELKSDYAALYDEMVAYYEITGNTTKKKEFCKKMEADNEWPAHAKNFAQNLLRSVAQNGILITHGELDTYPIYVVQEILSDRKDVKVISWELLHSEEYCKKIEKQHNIKITWNEKAKADVMSKLAADLAANNAVYFTTTFSPDLLSKVKDKLYITGTALRFSESEFDNCAELKINWEKNLRCDYLKKPINDNYTRRINTNYIPCLVMLRQIYTDDGDKEKAEAVKTLALKLARDAGKEDQLKSAMGLK